MPNTTRLRARLNLYPEFGLEAAGPSQKTPYAARTSGLQRHLAQKLGYKWVEDLHLKYYDLPAAALLCALEGTQDSTPVALHTKLGSAGLVAAPATGDKVMFLHIRNTGSVALNVRVTQGVETIVLASVGAGKSFTLVHDTADSGATLGSYSIATASSSTTFQLIAAVHDIA